jgi:hypothetical protein
MSAPREASSVPTPSGTSSPVDHASTTASGQEFSAQPPGWLVRVWRFFTGLLKQLGWLLRALILPIALLVVILAFAGRNPTYEVDVTTEAAEIAFDSAAGHTWWVQHARLYQRTGDREVSGTLTIRGKTSTMLQRLGTGHLLINFITDSPTPPLPVAASIELDSTGEQVDLTMADSLVVPMPATGRFTASIQGGVTVGRSLNKQNPSTAPLLLEGTARIRYEALGSAYQGQETKLGLGDRLGVDTAWGVLQVSEAPGIHLSFRHRAVRLEVLRPGAPDNITYLDRSRRDIVMLHPLFLLFSALWLLVVHLCGFYLLLTRKDA